MLAPRSVRAAQGAGSAAVRAWRGSIQIPTYLLGPADPNPPFPLLNPTPVYPYTMLDGLTNQRVPKTYEAIFLENKYLKVTILPQLGGHVYSIYDKVDQREVLYRNHVIKYGLIGPRGAWISGGIEFSFPFAHTDATVSPVESTLRRNPDGSATVVEGAIDWVSNMHWEIALTLRPQTSRLEQRVTLFNATPIDHLYLFWANAAVKATDDMQYIYPMRETISDNPFAVVQSWPVWKGVNQSWYKNNPSAMAIFARASHRNFFGVYYHKSNYGVVHVANFRQDPGKKLWSWGTADSGLIWASILSDHDGPYNEIQSGRFFTQGYREFMPPRRVESWAEYWYPVRGLDGGFVDATRQMSVNAAYLNGDGRSPEVKLIVSPAVDVPDATLVVKLGSNLRREFHHLHFEPLQPAAFTVPVANLDEARKAFNVQIQSAQGRVLLRWSAAEPVDGNPDFLPAAGTHLKKLSYTAATPLQELYLHGVFLQKRGDAQAALKVYNQVLARDPGYVPALLREAWHDYRAADFTSAKSLAARALARERENPSTLYAEGVIDRAEGQLTRAQDAFWAAIHYGGSPAPVFVELGEIAIRQGKYAEAARLLRRASSYDPGDAFALADLAVAERLSGNTREAGQTSAEAVQKMPVLPYALAEHWLDARNSARTPASGAPGKESWTQIVNPDPQNYVAVAAWYHNLGAWLSSDAVLHVAATAQPPQSLSPLIYYYLASNARREGKDAHHDAQKAASMRCTGVFPNRLTDEKVLEEAVQRNPADSHARYALGNFMFAHGRYAEASALWRKALDQGFNNPVLLRNLGVYNWKVKADLPAAAGFYARAIHLSPGDFRLYSDLDRIYTQAGDTSSRAALFHSAPPAVLQQDPVRARHVLFLMEQSQFDQALSLLTDHQFKPWEGGVEIHEMYAAAYTEKGKEALAAHRPAEAAGAFRRAMEYPENLGVGKPARPSDEEPLYWLGVALQAQGKTTEAKVAWSGAAAGAMGNHGASAVFSALALDKLGQRDEARQILRRCAQSAAQPNARASNYYLAGVVKRYSGHADVAGGDFHRALALNPFFWQARVALHDSNPP